MASTDDFTFTGGDHDKRLRAMHDALPGFDDSDPVSVVAGVLFLDQAAGKSEHLHHVLIQPALVPWLLQMVRVDDAKIHELIAAADVEDVTDEQLEVLEAQLTPLTVAQPFEVTFTSDDPEMLAWYPEIVRGKTIKLQVMSEEQAQRHYFFAATVDGEGHLIELTSPVEL
jgi:hypothetical protein